MKWYGGRVSKKCYVFCECLFDVGLHDFNASLLARIWLIQFITCSTPWRRSARGSWRPSAWRWQPRPRSLPEWLRWSDATFCVTKSNDHCSALIDSGPEWECNDLTLGRRMKSWQKNVKSHYRVVGSNPTFTNDVQWKPLNVLTCKCYRPLSMITFHSSIY